MANIAALVVAGGRGERAGGGVPKQFRKLGGTALLRRSVAALSRHPGISSIRVVVEPNQLEKAEEVLAGLDVLPLISGGATRQDSVRNGLEALASQPPGIVLIHDAARPFVSEAVIDRVISALRQGADCAVPLLLGADTLKREREPGMWTTESRDGLMRAQTPQGFRFDKILNAHLAHASIAVTDDMALAERAGMKIAAVAGEEINMKITTQEDFAFAERLLAGGAEYRTGSGIDAHKFGIGDHVWLCGVKILHDQGLEGHSDADVGLHALTDAILGALGAGDIGLHFPSDNAQWRGASSDKFLAHAGKLVKDAKAEIVHVDVTLICERPKVAPHRESMRARIAEILAIDVSRISVKATTMDGMGFTGRREGV